MAPLIQPRRRTPSRSALPVILLRTVLLVAAVIAFDALMGGTIRKGLSGGADGSLASMGERAAMSIRGTIDGSLRRVSVP